MTYAEASLSDNEEKVEMPMLPDLDDNTTSVLRQQWTCSECSWRKKILKVNKIELPKLSVGFILLWKTRVQAGATLFIEKCSKWSKNELFSLIVYLKLGPRPSYSALYYFVLFILSICSRWHKCGSFDWRRVPREKHYSFRSFIDTLGLFLARNGYSTRACRIWDDYSQLL